MSHLVWTPAQLADFKVRQHREDMLRPAIVATVNASDKPKKPARKRNRAPKATVPYFQALCALLRESGVPEPACEWQFDPQRRWRFDFCWVSNRIALEINGGLFSDGRHTRGAALLKEYEKINAAVLQGWRVLTFSPQQIPQAAEAVRTLYWHQP